MKNLKIITAFFMLSGLLLTSCATQQIYEGGSSFVNGFARVENGDTGSNQDLQSFYIDSTGQRVFDSIVKKDDFYNTSFYGDASYHTGDYLPNRVVRVKKDGKTGLLTTGGDWILDPVYDSINTEAIPGAWIVTKDDKKSFFTSKGFMLPFRFDDAVMWNDRYYRVQKDSLWGVYDHKKEKLVIPTDYQDLKTCSNCVRLLAQKAGKWGVIDFKNTINVPFKYKAKLAIPRRGKGVFELRKSILNQRDSRVVNLATSEANKSVVIDRTDGGMQIIQKNQKMGLVDGDEKTKLPFEYDYIGFQRFPSPYLVIDKADKKGVADTTGNVIVKPVYDRIFGVDSLENKMLFIAEKAGKTLLLDGRGQKVLPESYQNIYTDKTHYDLGDESAPYLKLEKNNKYGLYNPKADVLIDPEYDRINNSLYEIHLPFRVKVTKNGKESLLDVRTGKLDMPFNFESVSHPSDSSLPDNLFVVSDKGRYGVYDTQKNNHLIPLKYDAVSAYRHLFYVDLDKKRGVIDFQGKELLPSVYNRIHALNDSLFVLSQNKGTASSYDYYNLKTGKKHHLEADLKGTVSPQRAVIKRGNTMELYDPFAEKAVRGDYSKGGFPETLKIVHQGIIAVYKNGKAGLINAEGDYIVPLIYNRFSFFREGKAVAVKKDPKTGHLLYGYINLKGEIIVPIRYDFDPQRVMAAYFFRNNLVLLKQPAKDNSSLIGLAHRDGSSLLPPDNEAIIAQKNKNYYIEKSENKYDIVDAEGESVLPVTFAQVASDKSSDATDVKNSFHIQPFHFPLMGKKAKYWRYYTEEGEKLPGKFKTRIPFSPKNQQHSTKKVAPPPLKRDSSSEDSSNQK